MSTPVTLFDIERQALPVRDVPRSLRQYWVDNGLAEVVYKYVRITQEGRDHLARLAPPFPPERE